MMRRALVVLWLAVTTMLGSREALATGNLQLAVSTNTCVANSVQYFFEITNVGSTPVPISSMTIKYWLYDTSGQTVQPNLYYSGCITGVNGNPSCTYSPSGVSVTATQFSPACGPSSSQQANWEVSIRSTDSTVLPPGATWSNIQGDVNLANWSNFSPGTQDWYSYCSSGGSSGSYDNAPDFAVYQSGSLSSGTPPSCRGGSGGGGGGSDAGADSGSDAGSPPSTPGLSNAGLQVQVLTTSCSANQVQNTFEIVNTGSTPIALDDIAIKYWAFDTSGQTLQPNVYYGGCVTNVGGNPSCVHQVSGVTPTATQFPACGTAPSEANWEIAVTNTDTSTLPPGAIWSNIASEVNLANWSSFSPGTADWFSPCGGSSYAPSQSFAVYYQGTLVFSNGIDAPVCRSPQGSQVLISYTLPPASPVIGPVAPGTQVEVDMGMPLQNVAQLEAAIAAAANPASPSYRQWVSPAAFVANYAPSLVDYGQLVAWAHAQGFQVATYSNQIGIDILGTAAQIEQAFYVNLVEAQRPDGSTFYEPDRPPSINLVPGVEGMEGLDDYVVPVANTIESEASPTSLGPSDIAKAYLSPSPGYPSSCLSLTGLGQTIGLIEPLHGFTLPDVKSYGALATPGYQATNISVVRALGKPPLLDLGDTDETTLDIEMAVAMAPAAQIIAFENSTDTALRLILDTPGVNQVSTSWNHPVTGQTQALLTALASRGTSFFASSNDGGAYEPPAQIAACASGVLGGRTGTSEAPLTDIRALNYVTLVGGTQLFATSPMAPGATAVWNGENTWSTSNNGASGGGIFLPTATTPGVPIPSWQLATASANTTATGVSIAYRNSPDVSFLATGIYIFDTRCSTPPAGGLPCQAPATGRSVSGTSAAAPLWAAFTALMNAYDGTFGSQPVGFLNPALYQLGSSTAYTTAFHDIGDLSSNSHNAPSDNDNTCGFGYPALPGYDLSTGWGTPACTLVTAVPAYSRPVSVGSRSACAVTASGGVDCWGDNSFGELGNGTLVSSASPVPVLTGPATPLTNVASVSVGLASACALTSAGAVWCWGDDSFGQLGDLEEGQYVACPSVSGLAPVDTTLRCSPYASAVFELGGAESAIAVSVGGLSACALNPAGGVVCWGDDSYGELGVAPTSVGMCGTDSTPCSAGPVTVSGLANATTISVADSFACALTANGTAQCWGRDDVLQLGQATSDVSCGVACSPAPLVVPGLLAVQGVSAGGSDACAIVQNGSVECWGDNSAWQLGNTAVPLGTPSGPVPVLQLGPASAVFVGGGEVACAALASGGPRALGRGGLRSAMGRRRPIPLALSPPFRRVSRTSR